jgi:hypothetical protein
MRPLMLRISEFVLGPQVHFRLGDRLSPALLCVDSLCEGAFEIA